MRIGVALLISVLGCGGSSKPAAKPESGERPSSLSKADVQAGLRSVNGRVMACGARFNMPGHLRLKVQVDGEGRVVKAEALDDYAGTPLGGCAEEAMRHASFPVWQGPFLTLTVPYLFR
jgi:hypothetical protein